MAIKHKDEEKKDETKDLDPDTKGGALDTKPEDKDAEVTSPPIEKAKEKKQKPKAGSKAEYLSKFTVYHPFQKKRIEPGTPTTLEFDGWVEAQLEAGILIKA